jgi:hypothetical protein
MELQRLMRLMVPTFAIMAFALPLAIPGAEEAKMREEAKKILLGSIYSTSRQKGLKLVDQGQGDQAFRLQIRELQQQAVKMGASNVFLVRGDDIAAAVKATWKVFAGGYPATEPVSFDQQHKSEKLWLVAYLGVAGSVPPAWLVHEAQVQNNALRLVFQRSMSETDDEHPYFVWVPIEPLKAQDYTVELFDKQRKEIILYRKVTVSHK